MAKKGESKNYFARFWDFLKEDSWSSFIVTLLIAFILIKYVFFPGLSFITGSQLPLVIVESCSMYHQEPGLEKTFTSNIYGDNGLSLKDTVNWDFQNGFSKGDIIFVVGADNVKVGDIIIFNAGEVHPIIHRVVSIKDDPSGTIYSTKGDNYKTNPGQGHFERAISKDQIIGKALFKVPAIGWAKLIFFEASKPVNMRGFCS